YKTGSMIHMIRQIVDDDELWRSILRGMNEEFWHQTVTGAQVQDYISRRAGRDLSRIFAQYLTTTEIPVLEYVIEGTALRFRWTDVVPGFDMPVRVTVGDGLRWLYPTEAWQAVTVSPDEAPTLAVNDDFYVEARHVSEGGSP